jgi:hypothetical protein
MSEPSPQTVFRFTAAGIDLEFAGTEEFVLRQVERFRPFLEGAVHQSGVPAPAPPPPAPAPKEGSLQSYFDARPTREGRGAIQDRILLFVHYLQSVQGKNAASKEDIAWCFQQVGLSPPKNLLNALGNMTRKLGLLQRGGRRGLYQVAPKGRQYIDDRFSA